jgi:iron complex outermembrane receptor protein
MFRMTKVCTGVLAALGGLAMMAPATTVYAQDAQRIEITGSLIKRIEGETALPVTTLRTDELVKAGVTNAEQAVKFITQNTSGTVTSGSVSGTNGAAAYASLRSLGAGATLVLINGKRMVSNPFSSVAVDLNTIPMAAIDRIEVLTDGASATYGTDATAGVINFVMKNAFKGGNVDAAYAKTEAGGADVTTANLSLGIGDLARSGWNVYGAFNYRDQKPMSGIARDFMRTSYRPDLGFNGLSPTAHPANYTQPGGPAGNFNPALASGCEPLGSISAPEANGTFTRCFADTQVFTQVVPIQEQMGGLLKGSFALGNHTIYAEYIKTFNKVQTQIAPSPEGGLQVLGSSPFHPSKLANAPAGLSATLPVNVNWRTVPLGPRQGKQENNTQRAVLGVDGSFGDWFYQAHALWSNSKVENFFLNGYPMTGALIAGVRGDGNDPRNDVTGQPPSIDYEVVPLNPFGAQTAAGLAYLQKYSVLGKVQEGEGTLQSANFAVSGPLFNMAGGPAQLAVSSEFRKEDMVYRTDVAKVSQAASSGLAGAGALREGDRDITAAALELNLPITKTLEATLSVRHDKYSDFGNTTNPKVAFKFRPADFLLIRGSYNEGFTAPTLTALYAPNATTFTGNRYNDPVLCPGGVPAANADPANDCGIQFQRLTGGNDKLQPETSKAWNIGIVVQPLPSLTVGFDFWNYLLQDSVSTLGEQTIFGDPVKYASLFVRCSQAPVARQQAIGACRGATANRDPLAYILETNQNLGDTKTEGVDISVNWTSGATKYGRFSASLRGSYVRKYEFQVEPDARWFDPVGNYSPQFGGPVIRYTQVIRLNWDVANFGFSLGNRHISGYRDQNANGAPFNRAPFNTNEVGSYNVSDASVTWRGIKGLTLGLGIENLFDQDPPFTNQVARFQARLYDDRFHNPLGRIYRFSAKYEF